MSSHDDNITTAAQAFADSNITPNTTSTLLIDYAILNVITAYRNLGGRNIDVADLPGQFQRLYNALDQLIEQYEYHSPR